MDGITTHQANHLLCKDKTFLNQVLNQTFMTLLKIRLKFLTGQEETLLIHQMDGTERMLLLLLKLEEEILLIKRSDQMYTLLLKRTSAQLLTGDLINHQPKVFLNHTQVFKSHIQLQLEKLQNQIQTVLILLFNLTLNSLETLKELVYQTQLHTKLEQMVTLLTEVSKSEEPLSTERIFKIKKWN